eukprot:UN22670
MMGPFLDPFDIMRDILEPEGLPMGPILSETQHMYAAHLFGACPDNKRPGCWDGETKSKPTMCKNKQGDLVLMNGGSWPPCEEEYHPACADGSSLTCSDGSSPQPPQLCSNEEDVPTCQDENGNESDAECRRGNQIPTDFFCGK